MAFTKLRTFGDEAQPTKIHVGPANNGNKPLLGSEKFIIGDVSLETS